MCDLNRILTLKRHLCWHTFCLTLRGLTLGILRDNDDFNLQIQIFLENHKMVLSIKSDGMDYFYLYVRWVVFHPLWNRTRVPVTAVRAIWLTRLHVRGVHTPQVSQMTRIAVTGTRVRFQEG